MWINWTDTNNIFNNINNNKSMAGKILWQHTDESSSQNIQRIQNNGQEI